MNYTMLKGIFAIFFLLVSRTTSQNWPIVVVDLLAPPLEEVASVLNDGLKTYFASVKVSVVDSPDLSKAPFNLAAPGLSGNPKLLEVGSGGYLIPTVRHDKVYDVRAVAEAANVSDNALLVGASGIRLDREGDQIVNVKIENKEIAKQLSYSAFVDSQNASNFFVDPVPANHNQLVFIADLFVSDGNPGKVLEISVKNRSTAENFPTAIRRVLIDKYPNQQLGLGGTFQYKNGVAQQQIMKDLSNVTFVGNVNYTTLTNIYQVPAPLTAVGILTTSNLGLGINVFHFHTFTDRGVGGMYMNDTTPETAEYLAYFNVAQQFIRIDRPQV